MKEELCYSTQFLKAEMCSGTSELPYQTGLVMAHRCVLLYIAKRQLSLHFQPCFCFTILPIFVIILIWQSGLSLYISYLFTYPSSSMHLRLGFYPPINSFVKTTVFKFPCKLVSIHGSSSFILSCLFSFCLFIYLFYCCFAAVQKMLHAELLMVIVTNTINLYIYLALSYIYIAFLKLQL